jgi:hypothetical protein
MFFKKKSLKRFLPSQRSANEMEAWMTAAKSLTLDLSTKVARRPPRFAQTTSAWEGMTNVGST